MRSIVKRDIAESERGSIATLNDLPPWMLDEVRALVRGSSVGAVRYLRFYVAAQRGSSAEDFIEEVVQKGQDVATWGIHDAILVPTDISDVGTVSVAGYRASLDGVDGERWFRMRLEARDDLWSPTPGMVGVVRRQTRYWHTVPDGIMNCLTTSPAELEPVEPGTIASAIRRWIARRLAWWARAYLAEHPRRSTSEGILGAAHEAGPVGDPAHVTDDARIAAVALAREAGAFAGAAEWPQRAGFLGPEEWYAGESEVGE